MISRFTLGTVQMGTPYGINNKIGKPLELDSAKILEYAYKNGINSFDTASSYGNSEEIIGKWMGDNRPKNLYVTTKLASIGNKSLSEDSLYELIKSQVIESKEKLNLSKISNLLIHDFNDLMHYKDKLVDSLLQLKADGLVSDIGFSIYDLSDIKHLQKYSFDTIQIPASIFSHTILESPVLEQLRKKGVKIFARSIFVQGLIFMEAKDVQEKIKDIAPYMHTLNQLAKKYECTIAELAVNYALKHKNIDSVLIGVETINQLEELININTDIAIDWEEIKSNFSNIPAELIDPRNWN